MSSLFRELNRAAIEADLGKNAFKVFNTLLEQTLGYGKETDRLTNRQLCKLSQVRMDRFLPAVQTILDSGLFERRPAKKFQYRYTIGETFLIKNGDKDFFTPALPKKRTDFQKTEEISEKETHTALDLNPSLSSLLQPLQTLLSFSADMLQKQMQQQAQFISTLLNAQQNSTATEPDTSAGISDTYKNPTAAKAAVIPVVNLSSSMPPMSQSINLCESQLGDTSINISEHLSYSVFLKTEPKTEISAQQQSVKSKSVGVNDDNDLTAQQHDSPSSVNHQTPTKPKEVKQSTQATFKALALPKAIAALIPQRYHTECQTLLTTLNTQQQKNTFCVYQDMLDKDSIRIPMPLFRSLVYKAQYDELILPKSITEANEPLHPSMIIESNADRLARQDAEDAINDKRLKNMLRQEAEETDTPIEQLAKKKGLSYLLLL